MPEQHDGEPTRTVARCDSCGSIYVARRCSDGSFCLEGLAECPCDDQELTLHDSATDGNSQ